MCDVEEGEFREYLRYLQAAPIRAPASVPERTRTHRGELDRGAPPVPVEEAPAPA